MGCSRIFNKIFSFKFFILLRLIPTTSHNIDDVNETLSAFSKIRSKLNDGTYKKIAEKVKMN